MDKLAVAVLANEEGYGKALARGLANESERVRIRLESCKNLSPEEKRKTAEMLALEGYIVVTDTDVALEGVKDDISGHILFLTDGLGKNGALSEKNRALSGKSTLPLEKKSLLSEKKAEKTCSLPKLSPVKTIFNEIKNIYFKTNGIEFCRLREEKERIVGVFQPCGGSGATSISVTLARWIALLQEKPVLYVNASSKDDYGLYVYRGERIQPKKKMILHIVENIPWNIEEYCFTDKYGVSYLMPERKYNCFNAQDSCKYLKKLLSVLIEKNVFSYIVIDGLTDGMEQLCDLRVGVCRMTDKRKAFYSEEHDFITIYNMCDDKEEKGERDNVICIPEEKESFKLSDESIEISLEGIFGSCLRKAAQMVTERT